MTTAEDTPHNGVPAGNEANATNGPAPEGTAWKEKPYLKYYAPWTPHTLEYSEDTLAHMLKDSVRKNGQNTALEFFGASTSYAELQEQVNAFAAGLRHLGVKKGDRVAVILPNCPQHIIAYFAILTLGATVAEHNPLYTARELEGPFNDHGAKVCIAWDKVAPLAQSLVGKTPLETIISVNMIEAMPKIKQFALKLPLKSIKEKRELLHAPAPGTIPFSAVSSDKMGGNGKDIEIHPDLGPNDPALILFTSGTTGKPKGALLSHGNIMCNVTQGLAWVKDLGKGGQERYLAALPMFHVYGLTLTTALGVATGGKLVLLPKPEVPLIVDQLKKETPTYMPGVPTLYDKILEAADSHNLDLKGINNALSGAAPLPVHTTEAWEKKTGGKIIEGYGLTETAPIIVANPITPDRRAGHIGIPFPDTELRVADPEDFSRTMPDGEAGELLVRGPQVFKGYINIPDEDQPFFEDWFCTGDMAVMEPDGFIRIVSRIKEMIITGGFNVYPAEVEEYLEEHQDIVKAGVVGLPQKDGSEEVVAAIVLRDGVPESSFDHEAMKEYCREGLTRYKVPRRFFIIDEMPADLIGKIRRREVKDLVQTML
ncbi:long-chain fatty acid--CoA ligase [Corynebacterium sp. 320]|uniref:long-chain-fatty-acid--CoA ligase n=1 Tax=Corynebacterium TaxID=1716 RepID=UPI00125CAFA2|nr:MULTISPECIES: long-chain-fatty-acid--CoA ligase [Corynebacterium]KAB1504435.1 long-chain fatty acid--CoA ligase [Corynebacterium sp. 320]KAB1552466.1 long-chain fatty acid--CoA ligase [Corynebacterium sp. 321]KAB1554319.1 long-chain fatty acid--CoA ligase [Corynebacterium sp. 319]KAB3528571.1 long-chain fatty acid--CoA ligase [Corynebacterium sp. 250]KAB3539937.1 long-chain fatty acid--CoA ligase [Corynebacterium sp. 366]